MNNELRQKATNDFQKDFFKLMNNSVFGKTMENVQKDKDIKLDIGLRAKFPYNQVFFKTSTSNRNKKTLIMNKFVYLGSSILDII